MSMNESSLRQPDILKDRKDYSIKRLDELKGELSKLSETRAYPRLTIIAAGSLARHEASKHSDIDMFFFTAAEEIEDPRTKELRLFGKIIDVVDELGFPKFSRDCKYLNIISTNEMFKNLGSPTDDHQNFFTARMLLLLESKFLYGETEYNELIDSVIDYYYKDFDQHENNFKPTFLLNDICRYWKTILLNYENKRTPNYNDGQIQENSRDRTKRKVQNYKLKYSRVITCFATICAIGSLEPPVSSQKIKELIRMTPRERLEQIAKNLPNTAGLINDILKKYSVFIEKTGLSEEDINKEFENKERVEALFKGANHFGDLMFDLLEKIDKETSSDIKLIRHLVI
ncbi:MULTISPECIES: nucleotidyltransferase domain-containing protein [unclassified Marinobacter]|uniref:nucleotidyltransferase domain-containing protein n=1 Tax=unclassified Marinobacter TaxID=83889 RepID=UPI001268CEE8|nr:MULTISPECIES: nucleotidyltransferase domain-containing protein [unclassified Marinobacter]QFS88100.1 hypothetical protein FIV08_14795 [Marinobacter sp. THAF197a]QFT51885.1 hypothetical protein FIU96_14705 [Marinobacter sp. THAF39]